MTLLIVNNESPFTREIAARLQELNEEHVTQVYRAVDLSTVAEYEGVILSGRQTNNRETNIINTKIISRCIQEDRPLLGICYGAEILALSRGGSLKRLPSRVQRMETTRIEMESELTRGLGGAFDVYQSHGLAIARLPENFISVARSASCEHEIVSGGGGNLLGTQFHPEKSGVAGLRILANFVKICRNRH